MVGHAQAGGLVVLAGPPGVGKTQLAASLLRYLALGCGWSVGYAVLADVYGQIRAGFAKGVDEAQGIRKACSPRMVVLDEIQDRADTKWEDDVLGRIIDLRYRSCQPLLMLTNLDRAGLAASLGVRSIDRIRERGGIIDLAGWPSMRARG